MFGGAVFAEADITLRTERQLIAAIYMALELIGSLGLVSIIAGTVVMNFVNELTSP